VYLARQSSLGREVALKELTGARMAGLAGVLAATRLAHPAIVSVYELVEQEDATFVAMEYLERGSLRPLLGRLTPLQVGGALEAMLSGLAHAGGLRIAHGNLKPENVLISPDGLVKLSDFGMAAGGDPTTDLRAAGAIAYESLAGTPPAQPVESLASRRPDVDPALAAVIERLLAIRPDGDGDAAETARREVEDIMMGIAGPTWRRHIDLPDSRPATTVQLPATGVAATDGFKTYQGEAVPVPPPVQPAAPPEPPPAPPAAAPPPPEPPPPAAAQHQTLAPPPPPKVVQEATDAEEAWRWPAPEWARPRRWRWMAAIAVVALAVGGAVALVASTRSHHSAAGTGSVSSGTTSTSTSHTPTFTAAYKKQLDALLAASAAAHAGLSTGDFSGVAAKRRVEVARCRRLPDVPSAGGPTSITQLLCKALKDSLTADLQHAQTGSSAELPADQLATAAKKTFVGAYLKACKAAGLTPSKYAAPDAF
jgi:hypothetical protein